MNKWIVYSLKYRKGQAGFALPVAIGMGLIILLVGLTMLLRSQDSQVSAIAQKDTAKSLNAAETGVNEIRNLINDYRELAEFPACAGAWDSDDLCPDDPDDSSIQSWKNPSHITTTFLGCAPDDNTRITNIAKRTMWHALDPSDESKGEYRLIDYKVASNVGTLTVQGRVNADQPSKSVSQLEVKFPVYPSSPDVPGLWVQDSATTNQIEADILGECNDTSISPITQRISAQPTNNHQARQLDLSSAGVTMPAVPPKPSDITTLPSDFSGTLPLNPLEPPDPDGVYRYSIDELNNNELTIYNTDSSNPLIRIELWVDGDINLEAQKIRNLCGTRTNCGALTIKIFGLSSSGNINLDQGTIICDVFIHAPTYDVENSNTPGTVIPSAPNDCGSSKKNTGVFWVNTWTNSGSVRTPVLNPPRANWGDLPSSLSPWSTPNQDPDQPYPPQIGPIQSWETKAKTSL